MSVDVTRTLQFEGSRMKLAGLALGGVLMTAVSAVLAFPNLGGMPDKIDMKIIGFPSLAFFGLCTLAVLGRLIRASDVLVTISPLGIKDERVAMGTIPWSAVRNISTWSFGSQRMLVLAIDPQVEQRLRLTRISKMSRGANRALGADGLIINAAGLKTSHDELMELVTAYAAHYGAR